MKSGVKNDTGDYSASGVKLPRLFCVCTFLFSYSEVPTHPGGGVGGVN
jgi:hypothetical protein